MRRAEPNFLGVGRTRYSCFSLSYAAPRWFGNRRAAFEADLRHLLYERSPHGLFWDWPGDTELVIATKT